MTTPTYQIELPVFSGPMELLLHLIDRQELDITAISLSQVTEQYLQQVRRLKEDRVDHLIDFIVIGARLVLIKSRALLPQTPSIGLEDEDEEDPAEALLRQLRAYKRFKAAAAWLDDRQSRGLRTYLRVAPPPKVEKQLDLSGVTIQSLISAVLTALTRVEEMEESVAIVRPRRITIEGQIGRLRRRLAAGRPFLFSDFLSHQTTRLEVAVSLLAMLELLKQRELVVVQTELFGPIEIMRTPAASNGGRGDTAPAPEAPPASQ